MKRGREHLFFLGVAALFALIPAVLQSQYMLHVLIIAFIYIIVVSAWDLITGYAGIFSFGQIAFFVLGAYTTGILTTHYYFSPLLGLIMSGFVTSISGVLIAFPCLRVKGVYISLVTYALHLVLPTLMSRGSVIGTGGAAGIFTIPPLSIEGHVFSTLDKVSWYYLALVLALACLIAIYFIIKSSFGQALQALRDSEDFALSLGVNEYRVKLLVFTLSSFFTGLAGGFYAQYTGSVSTRLLGMDFFLLIMIMLTIGGMGRFPGAAVGALVITLLNELLRISDQYRLIMLGVIVVTIILIVPQGLIGLFESRLSRLFKFRQSRKGVVRNRFSS